MIVEGPVFERETIVHTEIDLAERELNKVYLDGIGHYSRPDLLTLNIRDEAWSPTGPQKLTRNAVDNCQELQDLLQRYHLTPTELEEILHRHLRAAE